MIHEATIATAPLLEGSILGDRIAEEIELETSATQAGVDRYNELKQRAINKGEGASLKPIERIMLHWYSPLRLAIRAKQRQLKIDGQGVVFAELLNALSADAIAVITMHETLSQCVRETDGVVPQKLFYAIGNAVQAEVNLHKLTKMDREIKTGLPKDLKRKEVAAILKERGGDADSLQMSARRMTPQRVNKWAKDKLDEAATNRVVCSHLGRYLFYTLLDLASRNDYDAPFELAFHFEADSEKRREGKSKAQKIVLDEELIAMINDGHTARSTMRPRYLPMVVAPLPRTKVGDGGYLRINTPFISKPTKEQSEAIAAADLTEIYGCVTDASASPWRINHRVLEIQEAIWESGGGDLGIPLREDPPKPPKPEGYDADAPRGQRWSKVDTDVEKAWRREAVDQHRAARKLKSDRKTCGFRIGLAKQFKDHDAIYYPHQLDFRTRAYPIPLYLNHQGDDVCRGLLEFAEAKPCSSDEAWEWLHVHTANCYGYDKLPFHERTAWTVSVEAQIRATHADPMSMMGWWGMAEKPWQFLAACFAICDPEAAARIPIQKDGVCNGLQQYAAMLRDPRAAAAVSMIPSDRPGDVYTTVAGVTIDRIGIDADAGNLTAKRLLGIVGRSVVKQTVMTTVYGVTVIGARDQLRDRLVEKGLKGQELYDASKYLQGIVFESIGTVCESATKAMGWIQECASLIAKKGELVRWDTPLGFPVVQPYRRGKTIQVRCKSLRLIVKDGRVTESSAKQISPGKVHIHGGKVRVARHRNSAAPNFVHSIDASHMLMTARACAKAGVTFAAVHDSFWTHAATTGQLDRILREQFVKLHAEPLLNKLRKQWSERYPEIKFPKAPEIGTYDVSSVLTSTYFFS